MITKGGNKASILRAGEVDLKVGGLWNTEKCPQEKFLNSRRSRMVKTIIF